MRILVCGGRDYVDEARIFYALDSLHAPMARVSLLIHGGARGADSIAGEWAKTRGVRFQVYPAQWQTHGMAAGPLRNQLMLDDGKPDGVVAFPGGNGTGDMVRRALAHGIKVWRPFG